MNFFKLSYKFFTLLMIALSTVLFSNITLAGGHKVESIHFLIPGGAGGGWDGTARGTGEALTKSGLVGKQLMKICLVEEVERLLVTIEMQK